MTYYRLTFTAPARAAAMVGVVAELERVRQQQPDDYLGRKVRADALGTLQEALDALQTAEQTDDDVMPPALVERVLERIHNERNQS